MKQHSPHAEEADRIRRKFPAVAAMVADYYDGLPFETSEVPAFGIEIDIVERLRVLLQLETGNAKTTAIMLGADEIVARNSEDGRKAVDRAIVYAAGDCLPPQDGGSLFFGPRFGTGALL